MKMLGVSLVGGCEIILLFLIYMSTEKGVIKTGMQKMEQDGEWGE